MSENEASSASESDFEDYSDAHVDSDSSMMEDVADESDYADDFNTTGIIAERDKSKSYEVDFKVITAQTLVAKQTETIKSVHEMFAMSMPDSGKLLRYYKWNMDRLSERFMENPEKAQKDAGITKSDTEPTSPRLKRIQGFTCNICCDGGPTDTTQTVTLSCGHRFCSQCWQSYLAQRINKQSESETIACMEVNCSTTIDENVVQMLTDEATFARYQILLNRSYVETSKQGMKFCPGPNCSNVIECSTSRADLDSIVPTVLCSCGQVWCFGCSAPYDHRPANCKLATIWTKKCADDSETSNWINANTKECPECNTVIEKNGGCNHMTCKKCKYEFCWICMKIWSIHGTSYYQCNTYNGKEDDSKADTKSKARKGLERYLFFYNRWSNHEESARLSIAWHEERTHSRLDEMQRASNLSWVEVQFGVQGLEAVLKVRRTLKWTYAMSFYLVEKDIQTSLFESNQRDLETVVEDLSELLEKNITPQTLPTLRQQILNKTAYILKRNEVLLSECARDFADNKWKFKAEAGMELMQE